MSTSTTSKRARGSDAAESEVRGCSIKRAKVEDSNDAAEDGTVQHPLSVLPNTVTNLENDFETLLDISSIDTQSQLQERFDRIARTLLYDYYIVVNQPSKSTKLEVMELEFYLEKGGFHEDPYTHGSEEQKVLGRWYFHRAPRFSADSNRSMTSTTIWRSGSRKGLDLTFGQPFTPSANAGSSTSQEQAQQPRSIRGGILLRSVAVLGPKSKIVSGPSLLVDEILAQSGAKEISELVNDKWKGDTFAFPRPSDSSPGYSLRLIPKDNKSKPSTSSLSKYFGKASHSSSLTTSVIYSSPRIGLDLSHPGTTGPNIRPLHSRIRFLPRLYRYFRDPHLLVANGRPQTFLGVLQHHARNIVEAKLKSKEGLNGDTMPSEEDFDQALKDSRLISKICGTTGLKESTARKYLSEYVAGRAGGETVVSRFVGPPGKGVSSSPGNYLLLVGGLSALSSDGHSPKNVPGGTGMVL